MEQAAWEAKSASLPILHPTRTTALLGTVPELVLGCREGTDSLVSTGASPGGRNWGEGGGHGMPQ